MGLIRRIVTAIYALVVVALLASVLSVGARADEPEPPRGVVDYTHPFVSKDAAAKAALAIAITATRTQGVEYGGVIVQCRRLFFYTTPLTQNLEFHIAIRQPIADRCSPVAFYHTHPVTADPRFSVFDIHSANMVGEDYYLQSALRSAPVVYRPGQTPVYIDDAYSLPLNEASP